MIKRIEWVDQVKGFGIFLVVYGHNFPFIEKYIYSFHIPLFFIIAGFFHPSIQKPNSIVKRIKTILIPYFMWSFMLFLFWWGLGRFYGNSLNYDLSVLKNFIGIFYAQGGIEYMDWGIPMWFLPTIFLTFILFYLIRLINYKYIQLILTITLTVFGFLLSYSNELKFIWSFDVALVSLIFYSVGFYLKKHIVNISKFNSLILLVIIGFLHFGLFYLNVKVDMYRSIYGNTLLFLINGFSGTIFYFMLFKNISILKFFSSIGKITIPILALQLRALTVIKFILIC